MKKLAKAKKLTINQAGIKLHKLEASFDVKEIGLSVNMVLNKDSNAPMDFFNEELINVCWEKLEENSILYEEKDGRVLPFNKYSLATFMADVVFSTFDSLSSKKIDAFKVYIDEAKDVLRRYERENGNAITKAWEIDAVVPDKSEDKLHDIMFVLWQVLDILKNSKKDVVIQSDEKQSIQEDYNENEIQYTSDENTEPVESISAWWMNLQFKPAPAWKRR